MFRAYETEAKEMVKMSTAYQTNLNHWILNRLSHTIYRKSPISILGTSGYEIYIFLEKNG